MTDRSYLIAHHTSTLLSYLGYLGHVIKPDFLFFFFFFLIKMFNSDLVFIEMYEKDKNK